MSWTSRSEADERDLQRLGVTPEEIGKRLITREVIAKRQGGVGR